MRHTNWIGYSKTIKVPQKQLNCYGLVRKKDGKVFWRNYHRELKNGAGLSFIDLIRAQTQRASNEIKEILKKEILKKDRFGEHDRI